jgi:hypothetical protein
MLKNFHKFTNRLYNKLLKIKLVKAIIPVFTVLLSYSIVRYFLYFNKLIIWLLGFIVVGFNWNDYQFLKEIKLLWDSLKLYVLRLFPNNEIVENIKDTKKSDMKQIIHRDHTNIDDNIDDDYVFIIADKLTDVKTIRKEIKESIISDGKDNTWSISEVISNPWIILAIVSAITISGTVVLYYYDISINDVTVYTWTHLKMGFVATVSFLGKLIRFFKGGGPRPPIEPNDDPIEINPNLNLPDSTISTKSQDLNHYLPIVSSRIDKGPMLRPLILKSDVNTSSASSSKIILDNTNSDILDTVKDTDSLINHLKSYTDKFDYDNIEFTGKYQKIRVGLAQTIEETERLFNQPLTDSVAIARKEGLRRLKVLYSRLPMKAEEISPTGSLTPTNSPPVNTDDIKLPSITDPVDVGLPL